MSNLKPITLYGHVAGPNPWKVALICNELEIPYNHRILDFKEVKQKPYTDINPNGRVPAIEDPNTGIALWESNAIIEYLVVTYDKDNKISYPAGSKEDWLCRQWSMYQASGQGPYFGQTVYFTNYEFDELARGRFKRESERVTSVLEDHLKKTGTGCLVGNKITYADLCFLPWTESLQAAWKLNNEPEELKKMFARYETYSKWIGAIRARDSVQAVWFGERAKGLKH